jgi:hypothetical protein
LRLTPGAVADIRKPRSEASPQGDRILRVWTPPGMQANFSAFVICAAVEFLRVSGLDLRP